MVVRHVRFLKEQLARGAYTGKKKREIEKMTRLENPRDYPVRLPQEVKDATCSIFGHICPVFIVNEPFSETVHMRRVTRRVSRAVALRVARRDENTCQRCGRHLRDEEVEFHHRIPFARGGSTDENNLEVACSECNKAMASQIPEDIMIPEFWSG